MSSKYDLVKVKISLGEGNHFVLSRFQLSKQLSFCELPESASSAVALELKKMLVNNGIVELSYQQYTDILFETLRIWGFEGHHTRLFRTMATFFAERLPLVLFVVNSNGRRAEIQQCASAGDLSSEADVEARFFTSAVALALSSKLTTTSSVVHASAALHVYRSIQESVWGVASSTGETGPVDEVATALEADVFKALYEGKVLVVDGGVHLDIASFDMLLNPQLKEGESTMRDWWERMSRERELWGSSQKKGRMNGIVLALQCCTDAECTGGERSGHPILPPRRSGVASEDAATLPPLHTEYCVRASAGVEACADAIHRSVVRHVSAALEVTSTVNELPLAINVHIL